MEIIIELINEYISWLLGALYIGFVIVGIYAEWYERNGGPRMS